MCEEEKSSGVTCRAAISTSRLRRVSKGDSTSRSLAFTMASRESPGSPLSYVGSGDDSDRESVKQGSRAQSPSASNMPPSKRRRTGVASWDRHTPMSSVQDDAPPPTSPTASISSDSSGDVPNSPSLLGVLGNNQDDEYSGQTGDQVTVCRWDGCPTGDLGNMDGLVQHIHHEHIGSRQKRYSCEWTDCSRKGQTHASAYALRAHMRSHTREKPFYCTLPGTCTLIDITTSIIHAWMRSNPLLICLDKQSVTATSLAPTH